jgi:hypothetical protein
MQTEELLEVLNSQKEIRAFKIIYSASVNAGKTGAELSNDLDKNTLKSITLFNWIKPAF